MPDQSTIKSSMHIVWVSKPEKIAIHFSAGSHSGEMKCLKRGWIAKPDKSSIHPNTI
ncbi:hypothetical protein [Bartonella sp. CB169]|uniref:hypothetical protein n=1 Tax=Bartonella sp. CB169 TaxID=3112257 RepID=UPI00300E48D3